MGPVRRTISLTLALCLTGASAYALYWILFHAERFKFWMPVSAGVLLFVGLYWLWADFINAEPRPEE